ncbi:MAG: SusC/RagA family TonB-linked outer membrane protein [Bacteroidales bacterium]|nr:SusC/RagA family TonB-linked outer membrane protein [Bacteroidales bacterium]MDD3990049.1 SusC/RagA family TonB-linked outer membrane protein [Bacteroidales bacterium]
MRKTILVSLCCLLFMASSVYSQEFSVSFSSTSLKEVLKAIEKQSEYTFVYNNNLVDANKRVSVEAKKTGINTVMDQILKNTGYEYKIVEKQIIISPVDFSSKTARTEKELGKVNSPSSGNQQTVTVSGKIVSAKDGLPVIGAYLTIPGTKKGTSTDLDGNFTLQIPVTAKTVTISCLGYQREDLNVNPVNLSNFKLITLEDATQFLNEVVVQGYGSTTVKDATGSVSRLTSKEIETVPMGSSVQGMLQGRAAGVNVMIQSSSPTSPISVTIRGVSTLSSSGTQPLWVIDGVPDYSDATSGDIANSLYNLNLTDVESIDILKDASATAIYGSRAANGVIIITTKRGMRGQSPTIDLNIRSGVQIQKTHDLKTLTLEEFKFFTETLAREKINVDGSMGTNEKLFFDESKYLKFTTSQWRADQLQLRSDAYMTGNTDWWKEMTNPAYTYQADLSVRGGTDVTNYYMSFGYTDINGLIKGGKSQLYTGRMNFETQIGKALKMGVIMSGSSRTANNKDALLRSIPRFRPDFDAYNPDGSINIIPTNTTIENPYITYFNRSDGLGKSFYGTAFAELKILPGLKFRSAGTINYSNSAYDSFARKGTQGYPSTYNYRTLSVSESNTKVWDNTLNYAAVFGKHDIVAVIGQSIEKFGAKRLSADGEGFPDEEILINIDSGADTYGSSDEYGSALASFFARANYKYMNRYLVTATFRADGSSKFGPNNRWGYFPSGAVAWIMSEEEFMKPINDIVPYLKLRFSIGESGSQNLGYYDWMTTLTAAPYSEQAGITPSNLGNPSLQWESSTLTDIGIDFGLFKERIRGTIGYYSKYVDNLIYTGSVPPNSSFQTINQNIGSITNKGWEFEIRGEIIKKKDMVLELGFNIATNSSIVNRLDGVQKEIVMPYYYEYVKLVEGGKIGDWFGYKTAGRLFATSEEIFALKPINPTTGAQLTYRTSKELPGDPYVLDQDGDGRITKTDRVAIGNFNPKFYGGFNLNFTWKDLFASANFSYSYGAKRLWDYAYSAVNSGAGTYNAYNYLLDNGYVFTRDPMSAIPRMGLSYVGAVLTQDYIFDASYIKLTSLNLNYRLPRKWFDKKFLSNVDITFQAANLFTITKYPGFDPQGNFGSTDMTARYVVGTRSSQELIGVGTGVDYSTYPTTRTFSLGLKLTFK